MAGRSKPLPNATDGAPSLPTLPMTEEDPNTVQPEVHRQQHARLICKQIETWFAL